MGPRSLKEPNATHFAPAARAPDNELSRTVKLVASSPVLTQLLEAVGGLLMILNKERQIVALNEGAMKALSLTPETLPRAIGFRTGESLGCVKLGETPNGCGTGRACANCGIAKSLMDAELNHRAVEYETTLRLTTPSGEVPQEYLVRVAPIEINNTSLLVCTLRDISDKKRRENLERVFLHDLMNTLNALSGFRTLTEQQLITQPRFLTEIGSLIDRAMDEVKSQRLLVSAEHERLPVNPEPCETTELVDKLTASFDQLDCKAERIIDAQCESATVETDRTLLLRVLTNMLKNALEATPLGGTVTLRCFKAEHAVVFAVGNTGKIPDEVANRIFTRSFSTKGESGRGLGTYSMKLFGERYLHGKLAFTTSEAEGTVFTLRLPLRHGTELETLTRLRVR